MVEGSVVKVRAESVATFGKRHSSDLSKATNSHAPILRAIALAGSVRVAGVNALNVPGGERCVAHAEMLKTGTSF